jgi:HAD superfamily hydrolase (TIGR01509 family)
MKERSDLTANRQPLTASSVDLVVFDMDGVLAHLDRERRLTILANITDKPTRLLHERIWASDFEESAEAGSYPTGEEYLAEFNRRIGCSVTREQWVRARREAMTQVPETLRIAEEIHARIPIALLTNNGSLLREALPEIVPDVFRVFGARAHASCDFQARKPTRAVFERMLARYVVEPSRALLIDDSAEYIEGARAAGLQTIRYIDPKDLRTRLAQFDVLI